MEFRGNRNAPPAPAGMGPMPGQHQNMGKRKHIDWATRSVRIELFIVLLGSALILAALSLFLGFNNNTSTNTEAKLVNTNKYQAVFLNGGITSGAVLYSTYFGHVTRMNDKVVVLSDVYYLTTATDQTAQNAPAASPQLTKLGCQQLHSPEDRMVINRSQMAFWENLKDDGKVVTAIKEFIKQNPKGPNCAAATTQTPATAPANTKTTTP